MAEVKVLVVVVRKMGSGKTFKSGLICMINKQWNPYGVLQLATKRLSRMLDKAPLSGDTHYLFQGKRSYFSELPAEKVKQVAH